MKLKLFKNDQKLPLEQFSKEKAENRKVVIDNFHIFGFLYCLL